MPGARCCGCTPTLVPLLDRELQATHHLPLAWYDVLLELNYGPDRRLRMSELGERVTLSRTRVSRLVDEMTAAGLVRPGGESGRPSFRLRGAHHQGPHRFSAGRADLPGRHRPSSSASALTLAELTTIKDALDKVIRRAADRSPA